MSNQELQNLISELKNSITTINNDREQVIKDTAYMVAQSTNKEHSRLIHELQNQNTLLMHELSDMKEEFKGFKDELVKWKNSTEEAIKKNTEYRIQTDAVAGFAKWLVGTGIITGIVNVAIFIRNL